MYYSPSIVMALILASCAVSNAGNTVYFTDELYESLECPISICMQLPHDNDLYRGTHILQPDNVNVDDSLMRF